VVDDNDVDDCDDDDDHNDDDDDDDADDDDAFAVAACGSVSAPRTSGAVSAKPLYTCPPPPRYMAYHSPRAASATPCGDRTTTRRAL
jgi:hypothetical protein